MSEKRHASIGRRTVGMSRAGWAALDADCRREVGGRCYVVDPTTGDAAVEVVFREDRPLAAEVAEIERQLLCRLSGTLRSADNDNQQGPEVRCEGKTRNE